MAKGRAKPLMGGQKYDKAILRCTHVTVMPITKDRIKCNEEFLVSRSTTPAKRKCPVHQFGEPKVTKSQAMLRSLGLV